MREITYFSANVVAQFDNKYDNMLEFNSLMMDASNNIFNKYNKEQFKDLFITHI